MTVSKFFQTKFQEQEIINDPYQCTLTTTSNTSANGTIFISYKPRTFYVVVTPYLSFPNRGFLAYEE